MAHVAEFRENSVSARSPTVRPNSLESGYLANVSLPAARVIIALSSYGDCLESSIPQDGGFLTISVCLYDVAELD